MDIIVFCYGKLDIDSELLSVRLAFEEKIKFWKKNFIQQIIKDHMNCKACEAIEHH